MNSERTRKYSELDEFICPNCGEMRNDAGNSMICKCENCGFQECPLCGDELNNGYCLGCHGHMTLENYHSIGECPECINLGKAFEEINNDMYKL